VEFWLDMVTAGICAVGLAFLAWWLFGRLLRPIPEEDFCVVIPGRGQGEALEQTVRAFVWLRGLGLLNCPVVIANVDLTTQGWEIALRLTARWPGVILWPVGDLGDYISRP
jgi:hypothetical protein